LRVSQEEARRTTIKEISDYCKEHNKRININNRNRTININGYLCDTE
jgi:hypothetical protein